VKFTQLTLNLSEIINNKKSHLFQFEYMLHKKLLEVFIGEINAHLFKAAIKVNSNEREKKIFFTLA